MKNSYTNPAPRPEGQSFLKENMAPLNPRHQWRGITRCWIKLATLLILLLLTPLAQAQDKTISHVVIVWLKEPGNEAMRQKFIDASQQLSGLPGVINRHVGVVLPSKRQLVDDTFDVAVTVTLKNRAALKAYLNNPKHKKILHEKIKPLVNRTVIYDFVTP